MQRRTQMEKSMNLRMQRAKPWPEIFPPDFRFREERAWRRRAMSTTGRSAWDSTPEDTPQTQEQDLEQEHTTICTDIPRKYSDWKSPRLKSDQNGRQVRYWPDLTTSFTGRLYSFAMKPMMANTAIPAYRLVAKLTKLMTIASLQSKQNTSSWTKRTDQPLSL